jgi:hypothetical protein
MRWQLPVVLILLGALIALVPLAHASPPDPIWITGLYDGADYDDVIAAATSADSAVEYAPLVSLTPSLIVVGTFHPAPAPSPATPALPAFQIRAPPTS